MSRDFLPLFFLQKHFLHTLYMYIVHSMLCTVPKTHFTLWTQLPNTHFSQNLIRIHIHKNYESGSRSWIRLTRSFWPFEMIKRCEKNVVVSKVLPRTSLKKAFQQRKQQIKSPNLDPYIQYKMTWIWSCCGIAQICSLTPSSPFAPVMALLRFVL